MGEQSDRSAQREAAIRAAARQLFMHYGVGKTAMEDIARAAGISKGAIYLHFASKDALLSALIADEYEILIDQLLERLDHDPAGYTVFNLFRFSVQLMMTRPLLAALYTRDRRVLGDYAIKLWKGPTANRGMEFGVDFIRHFQQAGMIRADADPVALSYLLMSMRYGLLRVDEFAPPPPSLEALGDELADMLQRAYGRDDGDQEAAKAALKALLAQGRQLLKTQLAAERAEKPGRSTR